ncbi:hypothetical protein [Fusobacterium polymorphum]|uniref:Uncharacterized protein n=1 Tax=Fusobacterium nucleatum subsp. polymorphum TaxID=76857 RepID=A0A2C6A4L9_FUSNP|nr:hypothetical protein [Fusobacterium polymorphum]PHI06650.1 hypothetical protein CBG54_06180 [Fusobacterium polymorphum]
MKKLNSLEARDKGFHQFTVRKEPYLTKIYLDNMSFYNNNNIKDKITNKNDLKTVLKNKINIFLTNTKNEINLYKYEKNEKKFEIYFATIKNLENGKYRFIKSNSKTYDGISENDYLFDITQEIITKEKFKKIENDFLDKTINEIMFHFKNEENIEDLNYELIPIEVKDLSEFKFVEE